MRKILFLMPLLVSSLLWAVDYEVDSSTNPVQASTLSVVPNSNPGDILGSIVINQRSAGAETLTIYDSSGVASGSLGIIDLSTGTAPTGGPNTFNEYRYNIRVSSAITFTKSAANSNITIIWKNVR